jgi:hypothetical protein
MPVKVPGQDGRKTAGNLAAPNDVCGGGEHVVRRTNGRSLDALVKTEHADVGIDHGVFRGGQQVREPRPHVVTLGWKPGYRDASTAHLRYERPRSVEDMNARMLGEPQVRYATALVVARNNEDRNASVCNVSQRLERLPHHAARRPGAIEHVAAVNDQVDLSHERRLQRSLIVGLEVMTATPAIDTRIHGQVEAEVRVGEQQDPYDVAHTET